MAEPIDDTEFVDILESGLKSEFWQILKAKLEVMKKDADSDVHAGNIEKYHYARGQYDTLIRLLQLPDELIDQIERNSTDGKPYTN